MPTSIDLLMSLQAGSNTVGDNLQHAIDTGKVLHNGDGTLELAGKTASSSSNPWLHISDFGHLPCAFLGGFLFKLAYAESMVPYGCKDCFKVRVSPRTLRELIALWDISKWPAGHPTSILFTLICPSLKPHLKSNSAPPNSMRMRKIR